MNTGRRGVITYRRSNKLIYGVTGPERTLIDITVRPFYSGGPKAVLEAYRQAKDVVSIQKL